MMSGKKISGTEYYALAFGLFLGLCIWKFGNPVILDGNITPPVTPSDFWNDPWPTRWANWIFLPLALPGAAMAIAQKNRDGREQNGSGCRRCPGSAGSFFPRRKRWTQTLTSATLWQFFGCVACYFLGALLLGSEPMARWLLIGVLAAFTFCLVRAIDQRLFEFPQSRQMLIEGERKAGQIFRPKRCWK
jgi:hypothetical protein